MWKFVRLLIRKNRSRKAINLAEKEPILDAEQKNIEFFENIPWNDRSKIDFSTVHGAQFLEPLFEFSGACAGCGETPYLKLLSQLFGDVYWWQMQQDVLLFMEAIFPLRHGQ